LQQAYATEQQVSRDQQNVQNAEKALAQILSSLSSSATSNAGKSSAGSTSSKPSSGSSGPSSSTSTTATNSAAQLATDQATIDNDQASLVQAQQSLSNATLTAPISGTVGSVNVSTGQAVSAASTSSYITVTNAGTYQATVSLSTTQVGLVAVGDSVQVAVDGRSGTVAGTVTRVGPVTVSSSSYTYPMIVSLSGANGGAIAAGSAAQVQVQVANAQDTLVVPTSAVHTNAPGRSYVLVVQGGQQVRKLVRTGVVGQLYTQITSGLSSGAVVVLADQAQAVPSSSTNSATTFGRGFGGGGGFGGGAGFGGAGGFGGGGVARIPAGGGVGGA
jgi:RND family efflux transporter MFP subunit